MPESRPNNEQRRTQNPRERRPVERKPISSVETPEDLLRAVPILSTEQAIEIFKMRDEIESVLTLKNVPELELTDEQIRAIVEAGFVGVPKVEVEESVEAVQEEESAAEEEEEKKPEFFLKRRLKAIIKPISWKDKSKIGYGIGAAAGFLTKASWFIGVGPVIEISLSGVAYGLNYAYDRYAEWKINSAQTAEKRKKLEEEYKRAFGTLRGIAAGYSATSLVNMAGAAVAPKLVAGLYTSRPFMAAVEFASQKASAIDTALRTGTGPIQQWWEKIYTPIVEYFKAYHYTIDLQGKRSVLESAGEVVKNSGHILEQGGDQLKNLGKAWSNP